MERLLLLRRKKRAFASVICVLLLVFLLGIPASAREVTNEGLTSLSGSGNVIVFILDRFDEEYAEKAFLETPEVYGELTGFTWYQDNIAMFGHTYPAVAWTLTNKPYSASVSRSAYQNSAFDGETPLKRLHDEGYAIYVYTQSYYGYGNADSLPDYFDNVLPNRRQACVQKVKGAAELTKWAVSGCLSFSVDRLRERLAEGPADAPAPAESPAYTLDMKEVYELLSAEPLTLRTGKRFSYIHLDGCHDVTYNEDWETPNENQAGDRAVAVRAGFRLINRYLQEMKRLGVYDDATIIITGDHSAAHHDGREVREVRLTALFVKPSGSGEGPLKISAAQVSQEDFWATVFRSEGLEFDPEVYGTPVFEVSETENRRRIHRWHTYQPSGKTLDEWVYEITGPGNDFSNWNEIGHEHYDKFLMD